VRNPAKDPSQKPQTRDPEGIQNTICTFALWWLQWQEAGSYKCGTRGCGQSCNSSFESRPLPGEVKGTREGVLCDLDWTKGKEWELCRNLLWVLYMFCATLQGVALLPEVPWHVVG
jgi:hypothetical protein